MRRGAGPAAFGAGAAAGGRVTVEGTVAAQADADLDGQAGELVGEVRAVVAAVGHDPDRNVARLPAAQGDDPVHDRVQLVCGDLLEVVAQAKA